MTQNQASNENCYEAEVLESTVINENLLQKVLIKAGRKIAQPAIEAFEIMLEPTTPPQVRLTMLSALTYLIMPFDLIPDLIPITGFSDDLIALTAVISLWSNHITPEIRRRAILKLDKWLPSI